MAANRRREGLPASIFSEYSMGTRYQHFWARARSHSMDNCIENFVIFLISVFLPDVRPEPSRIKYPVLLYIGCNALWLISTLRQHSAVVAPFQQIFSSLSRTCVLVKNKQYKIAIQNCAIYSGSRSSWDVHIKVLLRPPHCDDSRCL